MCTNWKIKCSQVMTNEFLRGLLLIISVSVLPVSSIQKKRVILSLENLIKLHVASIIQQIS